MKHIVSVTGIRSEYDILYSVYKAIEATKGLKLSLIATGAHLSKAYGLTLQKIREDGFVIADCVENLLNGDTDAARVKGAGLQLYGLAQSIERLRPDLLLAFGDREESITTALVGQYLHIPVAHISGGDRVVGNVDDQVRHAVTKLAHLHFTTNEESKERILKMGEQPFRVFNVGHPGLDRFRNTETMDRKKLLDWFGFPKNTHGQPLLLLIQHPLSSEYQRAYEQMAITLQAVQQLGFNTVISYPNSDPGSQDIIRCIREHETLSYVKIFQNIPRLQFVNALRYAACLLGNSSAGLMEAPFLKLPVVNVGNRQKARLHAGNVQFVPHDIPAIVAAVQKACRDSAYREEIARIRSPYGEGDSGKRIAEILASTDFDEKWLIKDLTY